MRNIAMGLYDLFGWIARISLVGTEVLPQSSLVAGISSLIY